MASIEPRWDGVDNQLEGGKKWQDQFNPWLKIS